jgi:hypothetical protein
MTSCDTLCKDQETFNKALDNYTNVKSSENKVSGATLVIGFLIMFFIIVWAIFLSMRVQDREHRILHTALAILASPAYILAYFLSKNY